MLPGCGPVPKPYYIRLSVTLAAPSFCAHELAAGVTGFVHVKIAVSCNHDGS